MKIILKKNIDELLQKDWLSLEKKNNYLIFQTLEWNLSWINQNKKNNDLCIVACYENSVPKFIFPFCIVKKNRFKILKWIAHDISDYLGPIIDYSYKIDKKNFLDMWNMIYELIKKECDLIHLDKQINEYFFIFNPIINYLKCKKYDQTYGVDLLKWNLLKKNKKKTLQKFRWAKKKLSKIGKLNFIEKIESIEEKKILIKKVIQWKKEKKENDIIDSFTDNFYLNFVNNDNFVVSGLKLNNNYISISLGFEKDKSYLYLVPSYKNDFKLTKYSTGKILMIELINYYVLKKFEYFDFCNGQETYKKYWTNKSINLIEYLKPINFKGLIIYFLIKLKNINAK